MSVTKFSDASAVKKNYHTTTTENRVAFKARSEPQDNSASKYDHSIQFSLVQFLDELCRFKFRQSPYFLSRQHLHSAFAESSKVPIVRNRPFNHVWMDPCWVPNRMNQGFTAFTAYFYPNIDRSGLDLSQLLENSHQWDLYGCAPFHSRQKYDINSLSVKTFTSFTV